MLTAGDIENHRAHSLDSQVLSTLGRTSNRNTTFHRPDVMHTYEEELRRLMKKSPMIELINHTFKKKKLKASTLPSDRQKENFDKLIIGSLDNLERDLIPDMRTDDIEHFMFLKMEQNQINTILLNGILENILHKPPTQSMNVSMQQILNVQGIEV